MARGKGEGGITFDKAKGIWIASVELPSIWDEEAGKWKRRRRAVSSKNKKIAMQKLQKVRKEVERGNLSSSNITVSAWVDHWLANIAPKKISPSTISAYRSTLKLVKERYGTKKIGQLTPTRIRELTADVAKTRSPGTARNLHGYLSHCLKDAVGDGLLPEHPMKHLTIPKRPSKAENAFTVEQSIELLKWLARQIDEQTEWADLAPLFIAYLLTGARRSELLGLTPERVGDALDVQWQLQWIKKADLENASADYEYQHVVRGFYLVRPKSRAGWRSYPLVEPLKSVMQNAAAGVESGELIFTRPDGGPWNPDQITKLWPDMLHASGIENHNEKSRVFTPKGQRVKLHGARHTVVDLLYMLDVPESVISDIVGHSSRQVTRGYRTKQSPAAEKAMQEMSQLLGGT